MSEIDQSTAAMPQKSRSSRLGFAVMGAGVLLALWVVAGRALAGATGDLFWVFAGTVGLAIVLLQFFTGRAIVRTARAGHRTRPATVTSLILSWTLGLLLGVTLPDATATGGQSLLTAWTGPDALDMSIALSNPLGILTIATSIAALAFATSDARGRRPSEDDILDGLG